MIPVRLHLKNFLSYADPEPLDFTTFDVACLSGDNGVGKSALLDAMTWAMFGAARGCEGGMNQDRLIRDGTDEAVVDFTFDLGGDRYRIVRRRTRNEKGESKGDVRLLVADGDDWKNIAAENMKATDAKIESVLRMDYRTFTASAFFLQGQSEDFLARMSPSDRKDVFARLLDLGVYEELEDAAKLRARESERARMDVAARIGELEGVSVDVGALAAEHADATRTSAELDNEIVAADAVLAAGRDALAAIETQQALLDRERVALAVDESAQHHAIEQADVLRAELARIDELLSRADEVAAAIAELERLRAADVDARADQAAAAELQQRGAEIAGTIESERRTITKGIETTQARIDEFRREQAALEDVQRELVRMETDVEIASDVESVIFAVREQLESQQLAAGRLEGHVRSLDDKLSTTKEALAVLEAGGGECPVCGAPLDAAHRAQAKRRIQAEAKEVTAARSRGRADLATAQKEAKRLGEEIKRLEAARHDRERLLAAREGLVARLERLSPVAAELERLAGEFADQQASLVDDAFAADQAAELRELQDRWTTLYDSSAHEAILRSVRELEPYAAVQGSLEEAARRRPLAATDLEAAIARHAQLAAAIANRREATRELEARTEGRPAALEAVAAAQDALEALRASARELAGTVARLEERLTAARTVEAELGAKREDERRLATEHRRYRRLAEAFGRGGIPDLVIDNAIPELIDDANQVLGRLTDYEMSVHFELLGRTKSGKAKETFNVLVSHDGGVRDYAMFSGGEAFRVAFAVRLAMSKLLVHRAGARLETLVIDEGFGTQDPYGRERLVEAINLARQEFAKIIVITHLDDLKDQFGAQIAVTKGINGSELQLSRA